MPAPKPNASSRDFTLADVAFRRYAPALHRYIERRMKQPATSADLTQEIFERFLQVKNADAVRNPQAYLFGIASHVIREAQHRETRNRVTYDSGTVDQLGQQLEHSSPDDTLQRISLQQELQWALGQLPPMQRVVLLLVKRDGLSYEEVAEKTQLSVATVTSYVFDARSKVKMLLRNP